MRNWGELLPDLLDQICTFIIVLEDLVSFGGVCEAWRRVVIQWNGGHPFLPLPCLMLAEEKDEENKGHRDFYRLKDEKTFRLSIPELKGKMCMETKGWLLTSSSDGEMSLVNPVTREQISLPHQNTFKYYHEFLQNHLTFVTRAVLSSRNPKSSDCLLMVIHGGGAHLGFCQPGVDQVWTVIEDRKGAFQAIEFYRGKFYAASWNGCVWECDLLEGLNKVDSNHGVTAKIIGIIPRNVVRYNQLYLVKSTGHLLIVSRDGRYSYDDTCDYGASEFKVFEFDITHGSLREIDNLGGRSIFLGHSATLSVDTHVYPELFPNSIYYTDDCDEAYAPPGSPEGGGKDMGIYNLSEKTIRPHYSGKSLSPICPPIWTFLAYRIGR